MKSKLITCIFLALAVNVFVACDDNTDAIGSSLINNFDKLNVQTDTFNLSTRSIVADSVLSRRSCKGPADRSLRDGRLYGTVPCA